FLVDYNLQKYAAILLGKIANDGWLDLIPLSFIFFQDIELPMDSNDRVVWRLAQQNGVILLTANRNMKGEDSLEQVIREDNTPDSLPVITIGNLDRFSKEASYRSRCADRII
ncbi:MAG: ACP S-malonyltransferase, partial [Nostoc sp.]